MRAFDYDDYKDYVRARIASEKNSWGLVRRMAEAVGCQRSYLSQVLTSHVHLTKDQAYGLCEFWELDSGEMEYFMTLVELDRAAKVQYRRFLENRLRALKREDEDLSKKIKKNRVASPADEGLYYSSWLYSAAHIISGVPEYQDTRSMALRLGVPEPVLKSVLEKLEQLRFVKREGKKWVFTGEGVHVPRSSAWVSMHHGNWRQRAVLDAQADHPTSLHYTMVQSMTPEVHQKIKRDILALIEKANRIALPSDPKEVYAFCCDLFVAG